MVPGNEPVARFRKNSGMTRSPAPQADQRPLVLLVEDDDGVRRSLQLLLTGRGYRVRAFSAAAPAIADSASGEAALLVADYRLADSDGVQLLAELRARGWVGRAVLVTAFPSRALDEVARAAGFDAVIEKPLRQHTLFAALAPSPD
jgi:FixJ family two-component response regulator